MAMSDRDKIYLSKTLIEANSLEEVVALINKPGGVCEGMEGVEFTPAQLAGQYVFECADESGYGADAATLDVYLQDLGDVTGATFDHHEALAHALKIAAAQ